MIYFRDVWCAGGEIIAAYSDINDKVWGGFELPYGDEVTDEELNAAQNRFYEANKERFKTVRGGWAGWVPMRDSVIFWVSGGYDRTLRGEDVLTSAEQNRHLFKEVALDDKGFPDYPTACKVSQQQQLQGAPHP